MNIIFLMFILFIIILLLFFCSSCYKTEKFKQCTCCDGKRCLYHPIPKCCPDCRGYGCPQCIGNKDQRCRFCPYCEGPGGECPQCK